MLFSTEGIVLKLTKFKENSAVVKIYTKNFGLKSYIVNGLYSNKAKNKIAYFQPLNLLDLVVYNKPNNNLNRIKEQKHNYLFTNIPFNFLKRTILQVVNEVLIKSIKEEEPNEQLFAFLYHNFVAFDNSKTTNYFLHLFLIRLTSFLGFEPLNNFNPNNSIFDLQQGNFINLNNKNTNCLNAMASKNLNQLLNFEKSNIVDLKMFTTIEKRELLESILKYYKIHIEYFDNLKSIKIIYDLYYN